ncbi:MAG: hypothetical protein J0I12_25465 [Candidatus Eremiobacteraeota bacterium]|mgnify:CR=1 FL=1|nr:hypothetical protein [Candidatus Eremiobacteraeota bacterium]
MTVFPDFSLQDEDGYLRHTSEFHPALFVWLRQLGCRYARAQIQQLRKLDILDPVKLVLISPCPPPQARLFRRQHLQRLPCALLSDTQFKTYEQNRLKKPPFWSFLDKTLADPLQNGKIILTRPSGQIHFRYLAYKASDRPDTGEFLKTLRRLRL